MDAPSIGVIFDMDGVLVDSAEPHFQSWRKLGEECRQTVTRAQFAATFGRQNRDIIPLLFGDVGRERTEALADRKEAIYRDLILVETPLVEGAAELIRALHNAEIAMAVGSSGPRANIDLVLNALNAIDIIRVIVSGDDVTRGKPDPQVFGLACDRLGLAPHRCVVVEDAPVGVGAARAAGAQVVAILIHHPAEAFQEANLIVDRLADLTADMLASLVAAEEE